MLCIQQMGIVHASRDVAAFCGTGSHRRLTVNHSLRKLNEWQVDFLVNRVWKPGVRLGGEEGAERFNCPGALARGAISYNSLFKGFSRIFFVVVLTLTVILTPAAARILSRGL